MMSIENKEELAPVVLFVHRRPTHTLRTIKALAANEFANKTRLIVYADAARNEQEREMVQSVIEVIKTAKGFKEISIIKREVNYGLSRNIIDGITETCSTNERVIVLEDDIVTTASFLKYMNQALERYENESQVWHISGWNYPINTKELGDAFFWRVMNCWGWATWSDRWQYFNKDPNHIMNSWDTEMISRFNLDGAHHFYGQVLANYTGKINTWAIFWYATIFENNGFCLNPAQSFVHNIGNDGTGVNCGITDSFDVNALSQEISTLPDKIVESKLAVERIKSFYSNMPSFKQKLVMRLKNYFYKSAGI